MSPDVVCLQETKTVDENFPSDALADLGYHVSFFGQKTYNGVAILSKHPIDEVIKGIPGFDDPQRRVLAVTVDSTRIINVYVPNGHSVGSQKYEYKLEWLERLHEFVRQQLASYERVLVTGDFNIAPADEDVHDPQQWQDAILCSEPERDQLRKLIELGLHDAFRLFDQPEQSFSWWDYRAAGFRRGLGLRIDLILVSDALRAICKSCIIDKEPRRWEKPSDHTPVMAEF